MAWFLKTSKTSPPASSLSVLPFPTFALCAAAAWNCAPCLWGCSSFVFLSQHVRAREGGAGPSAVGMEVVFLEIGLWIQS